ncbi:MULTISPECIES: arginine deiminase family protein [unclassified Sphingopyxis]|uniref:dimethylarginine dimethylaminohydrolase family protein n=1 Tax=unclassified Sphingopyxis TaxID=2614943 RepID=UPI0024AD0AF5|nr:MULTISPECIES: arginine deiminase family protein [unclassified Sphingopyxis]
MTSPFAFTHALCRTPAPSAVNGIRAGGGPDPDLAILLAEHEAYVRALRELGLAVDILPPLDDFPDALFTEDVALTFPEGAILLRTGAPTRAGEVAHIRGALAERHPRLLAMAGSGHADGGDVLRLADRVIIGLSDRTDGAGAEELAGLLAELGYRAEVAETPQSVLHFKTGCSLIDERTVLTVPAMRDCPEFAGLEVVLTPPGEEGAANILRVRDTVLIGERWTATQAMLAARGVPYRTMATDHVARLDAGLSCMSLRW